MSRKKTKSRVSLINTQNEQYEKLLKTLDIFAAGLEMIAGEFNDRMQELKTGTRTVRGNEGVVLGEVKTGRK